METIGDKMTKIVIDLDKGVAFTDFTALKKEDRETLLFHLKSMIKSIKQL